MSLRYSELGRRWRGWNMRRAVGVVETMAKVLVVALVGMDIGHHLYSEGDIIIFIFVNLR